MMLKSTPGKPLGELARKIQREDNAGYLYSITKPYNNNKQMGVRR